MFVALNSADKFPVLFGPVARHHASQRGPGAMMTVGFAFSWMTFLASFGVQPFIGSSRPQRTNRCQVP
jgi:hypothetical protein